MSLSRFYIFHISVNFTTPWATMLPFHRRESR